MNLWTLNWILWIAWFTVAEFTALATNAQNTLSWNVWRLEDVNLAQPFDFSMWTDTHWIAASIVWLLFLWLSLHLPFGLLR